MRFVSITGGELKRFCSELESKSCLQNWNASKYFRMVDIRIGAASNFRKGDKHGKFEFDPYSHFSDFSSIEKLNLFDGLEFYK